MHQSPESHWSEELAEETLDYENVANDERKRARDEDDRPPKLEPIENAGGIRLKTLRGPWPFLATALSLLRGDFLKTAHVKLNRPKIGKLNPAELLTNKVAVETRRGRILMFMAVFTLAKRDGGDRFIGHPAEMNDLFKPPPMHLMTLSSLLAHLSVLARMEGSLTFLEMDFKNFFPQVPLGGLLQQHMGIATRNSPTAPPTFLLQAVLTQGWNGSTYVAQSIAWSSVALRIGNEDSLGLCIDTHASPPPYQVVHHSTGSAIIVIVYDNVLVACTTPTLAELWNKRIERNLAIANIARKYINGPTPC